MLRFQVEDARGKAIPSVGALGGCGDTLAYLRSTGKLLFDVLDHPDYVREFELYLMKMWTEVYDKFYDIIHEGRKAPPAGTRYGRQGSSTQRRTTSRI